MQTNRCFVLALVIVGALTLNVPPASPATPEELDQLILDAVESGTRAAVEHAESVVGDLDPATALASLEAAIAQAETAAAAAATADSQSQLGKRQKAVRKKIAVFQAKLDRARTLLAAGTAQPLKINKAIGLAVRTGLKAVGLIRKKFPILGIGLLEKNARSAGFHDAGALVNFKLLPGLEAGGDPCTELPEISAVATPPGALNRVDDLGNGRFRVLLGEERGLVSVRVTACGVTRTWLLYNSGDRADLKNPPVELAGSWSGIYRTTGPTLCAGFTGSWTATFQVDGQGNIGGTWNGDGFAGTISGKLSGSSAAFTITGSGDARLKGTITGTTVTGSFTGPECTPASGSVKGTFQGTRTQ